MLPRTSPSAPMLKLMCCRLRETYLVTRTSRKSRPHLKRWRLLAESAPSSTIGPVPEPPAAQAARRAYATYTNTSDPLLVSINEVADCDVTGAGCQSTGRMFRKVYDERLRDRNEQWCALLRRGPRRVRQALRRSEPRTGLGLLG